jgi:hypothetical protein
VTKKYVYTENPNEWTSGQYSSPEEAFDSWVQDCDPSVGTQVYIAEARVPGARELAPTAEQIVEQMAEVAYDMAGDIVDDWLLTISEEALRELDAEIESMLVLWFAKHKIQPKNFYEVLNATAFEYDGTSIPKVPYT